MNGIYQRNGKSLFIPLLSLKPIKVSEPWEFTPPPSLGGTQDLLKVKSELWQFDELVFVKGPSVNGTNDRSRPHGEDMWGGGGAGSG